jgi:hypothetical protein
VLHDKARSAGFVFSPPWMAGMPEMQEQFPASAMDGGHAEIAGAFFGGAWMARIPKTKEHFSPPWTAGDAGNAGAISGRP